MIYLTRNYKKIRRYSRRYNLWSSQLYKYLKGNKYQHTYKPYVRNFAGEPLLLCLMKTSVRTFRCTKDQKAFSKKYTGFRFSTERKYTTRWN